MPRVSKNAKQKTIRVVLFTQSGLSPFHLAVPLAVFKMCFEHTGLFDVRIAAEAKDSQLSTEGIHVRADGGLRLMAAADVVIVAGWPDLDAAPSAALTAQLVRAHQRGTQIVGLCYGAYALAYAGLLDGKRASTHWLAEEDFGRRFPRVQLDLNALYVDEAGVITSAGIGAALDCCLYLVRKLHGAKVANKAARIMVLPPHREGGQAQFIEQPVAASPSDVRMRRLLDYMRAHLKSPLSLDALAERVSMSRRTFTRHFNKATGMTVGAWLSNERLRAAKDLLESTNMAVERVGETVGFNSGVSFRQHFHKVYQVSPREWRKTFQCA